MNETVLNNVKKFVKKIGKGSFLYPKELASFFGCGSGEIYDALHKLEGDGIVRPIMELTCPNCGNVFYAKDFRICPMCFETLSVENSVVVYEVMG